MHGSPPTPEATLTGEVATILYRAPDRDFALIRLSPSDVIVSGPLLGVCPGERVRLTGHWTEEKPHGRRFQVRELLCLVPETLTGLERYLGSGLVAGVGPGLAHRLVERWGMDLWRLLDEGAACLADTPTLGATRASKLIDAWHARVREREAHVFLAAYGFGPELRSRIHRRYREDTIWRVTQNPYILSEHIHGVGFVRADELAMGLGLARDSLIRGSAALSFLQRKGLEEGHVALPTARILEDAAGLGLSPANVLRAIQDLSDQGKIVLDAAPEFTDQGGQLIYNASMYRAEELIADRLSDLGGRPAQTVPWHEDEVIAAVEGPLGLTLDVQQARAVQRAQTCALLTITGGPGTGKTTLVKAILAIYRALGIVAEVAAPTGRAAKRLAEATGVEARTVHRLLEVQGNDMSFRRNEAHPIEAEVLLLDEASMLDVPLFAELLKAMSAHTRLVLVGDVHQLPPVGPGNVLSAVIGSGVGSVVTLDQVYRQGDASLIAYNARRINLGLMPRSAHGSESQRADYFFMEVDDDGAAVALTLELVQRRLPDHYGFDPVRDIQVLCPSHRGPSGVLALNIALQEAVNPLPRKVSGRAHRFRKGDKVLQGRNNYDKGLFNGDIGWVVAVGAHGLRVRFDDRIVALMRHEVGDLTLAYAMTIHKAQGSEFDGVISLVLDSHGSMLRRNLVYTALTRARRLAVIVGSRRALKRAIGRSGEERRFTRLETRIRARKSDSLVSRE